MNKLIKTLSLLAMIAAGSVISPLTYAMDGQNYDAIIDQFIKNNPEILHGKKVVAFFDPKTNTIINKDTDPNFCAFVNTQHDNDIDNLTSCASTKLSITSTADQKSPKWLQAAQQLNKICDMLIDELMLTEDRILQNKAVESISHTAIKIAKKYQISLDEEIFTHIKKLKTVIEKTKKETESIIPRLDTSTTNDQPEQFKQEKAIQKKFINDTKKIVKNLFQQKIKLTSTALYNELVKSNASILGDNKNIEIFKETKKSKIETFIKALNIYLLKLQTEITNILQDLQDGINNSVVKKGFTIRRNLKEMIQKLNNTTLKTLQKQYYNEKPDRAYITQIIKDIVYDVEQLELQWADFLFEAVFPTEKENQNLEKTTQPKPENGSFDNNMKLEETIEDTEKSINNLQQTVLKLNLAAQPYVEFKNTDNDTNKQEETQLEETIEDTEKSINNLQQDILKMGLECKPCTAPKNTNSSNTEQIPNTENTKATNKKLYNKLAEMNRNMFDDNEQANSNNPCEELIKHYENQIKNYTETLKNIQDKIGFYEAYKEGCKLRRNFKDKYTECLNETKETLYKYNKNTNSLSTKDKEKAINNNNNAIKNIISTLEPLELEWLDFVSKSIFNEKIKA